MKKPIEIFIRSLISRLQDSGMASHANSYDLGFLVGLGSASELWLAEASDNGGPSKVQLIIEARRLISRGKNDQAADALEHLLAALSEVAA